LEVENETEDNSFVVQDEYEPENDVQKKKRIWNIGKKQQILWIMLLNNLPKLHQRRKGTKLFEIKVNKMMKPATKDN